MDDLLHQLAAWRGVEVAPGTELRFELSGFPGGGGLGLLVILGWLAALALVAWIYRRDGHRLGTLPRLFCAALRGLAITVLTLVLLEPNLVAIEREQRPAHSLVLIDTSQSMAAEDAFRDPTVAPLAAAWTDVLGGGDPASVARLDLASALLAPEQGIVKRLASENSLRVYGFGAAIEELERIELQSDATPSFRDRLDARGRYTDLGTAVRSAMEASRGANIASLILFSDGRSNLGARGIEIARSIEQRRIPHTLVVPIGDPSPQRTIQVERIDAPDRVFEEDPYDLSVVLAVRGHDSGQARVDLFREQADGTRQLIATQELALDGVEEEVTVAFPGLTAGDAGRYVHLAEVTPPAELELRSEQRHIARQQFEVLGQSTRVLLIAGSPSHEYRILRNLLTRDDTVELACWLSSADPDFPQDGNVSLDSLPLEAQELKTWDVFVLLDPDPSRLPREFCEGAAREIAENGAGLWWICGEKYTLDALRLGAETEALAQILPIEADLEQADLQIGLGYGRSRAVPWQLTPEGELHRATQLAEDRGRSLALWSQVAGFYFAFPVTTAKPAARVLVEHRDPSSVQTSSNMPLVASQFFGAGRVLFNATDDTYRWRAVHEEAYNRLWVQGLRWLFEGRLGSGVDRMRVDIDRDRIELGQSLRVEVEAKDESYQALVLESLPARLERIGSQVPPDRIELRPIEAAPGLYETEIRPQATGLYRLQFSRDGEDLAAANFQVVPTELERPGPVDRTELAAIAAVPGGQLLDDPRNLASAVAGIPSLTAVDSFRSSHSLWDNGACIALLLTLLAAEWWFRKRFNLL